MQKTTNKKDKDLNLFINWLNQNGAEFSNYEKLTMKSLECRPKRFGVMKLKNAMYWPLKKQI